jgi:hypothetical protein
MMLQTCKPTLTRTRVLVSKLACEALLANQKMQPKRAKVAMSITFSSRS